LYSLNKSCSFLCLFWLILFEIFFFYFFVLSTVCTNVVFSLNPFDHISSLGIKSALMYFVQCYPQFFVFMTSTSGGLQVLEGRNLSISCLYPELAQYRNIEDVCLLFLN
jgi:hypothetical protein